MNSILLLSFELSKVKFTKEQNINKGCNHVYIELEVFDQIFIFTPIILNYMHRYCMYATLVETSS